MIYKMRLPAGWYPKNKKECIKEIEELSSFYKTVESYKKAGIVPHAGWFFCGRLIGSVIKILKNNNPNPDLIGIIGGHLSSNSPVLYLGYDEAETPLGNIRIDKIATEWIISKLNHKYLDPNNGDNTIEIVLPFIKYFFPETSIIAFRSPSSDLAIELGSIIREYSESNGLNIILIGASDLTHYGPNYGFAPGGIGESGRIWAKENDNKLIDKIISLDSKGVIKVANNDYSSCSPGPISTIIEFAKDSKPYIVDYYTSYDIYPSDSFVGYVGVLF